jgi:hypothetical protein
MKTRVRLTAVVVLMVVLSAGCTTPSPAPSLEPARWRTLGTVQLDPEARCVFATGYVNQVEGAIELLACGPGGKVHESVLVLQVNPLDLQAALLLIGLKSGPPMPDLGVGPPQGDRVRIWVHWQEAGSSIVKPLEALAYAWRDQRSLRTKDWVFTGSVVENGKFKALAEESLIASYWDPWAIINVQSPLGADDDALSVNRAEIPPLHTPVTLIMEGP